MKKKIFLADDSVTIQRVVELTFPEPEFEVVCVSNGAQAIERVAGFAPDIALLDVVMPEKTGYDVCAHIKKDPGLKWMPVLLISGTFDPYDEKRATEAGAAGRLTKPFESRGLITRVEELIAAHPNPSRPAVEAPPAATTAMPSQAPSRSSQNPPVTAGVQENAIPVSMAGQTMRMATTELFATVPAGAPARAASPSPAPQPALAAREPQSAQGAAAQTVAAQPTAARTTASQTAPAQSAAAQSAVPPSAPAAVAIPQEMLERAVREAVSSISDKVIREVAWEVIPDIAEAIITRRIRELEEEAGRTT